MMKKTLACTLFLCSAATMPALADDDSDTLFKFDRGVGSQPLAAGGAANTTAGVAPGGRPWVIESLRVDIKSDGRIRARGKGLLLAGGDTTGSRGGPRQVVASLFCRNAPVPPAVTGAVQAVPYNSEFVDLDADGDFRIDGLIVNASAAIPTADCDNTIDNRPILLIRTVVPATATTPAAAGAWFAAGLLKGSSDDSKGKD